MLTLLNKLNLIALTSSQLLIQSTIILSIILNNAFIRFFVQVLPLENEMKNPKKFGSVFGVLNASMLPISLLYTVVGLLGYLKYGENTKGSITLDMPQTEV